MIPKQKSSNVQPILWIFAIVVAVGGFLAFKFGLPMILNKQADRELLKTPAYQQIAKWEPEAYAKMKAEMIDAIQSKQSPAVAQGRVRKVVEGLAKKYMKTADDAALVAYIKVTADEIQQVADKDSDVAFDMLFSNQTNIDITKYVDPETQKRDQEALAEVIRSGVAKEAGVQDDHRATQLLREVVNGMHRDYGNDADLAFNPAQTTNKSRSVQMALQFYTRVLSLRSDQSAKVLRLLFSKV
ncbi:MAG TPA: hypothetical protein VER58_21420 [Thermoanaerobaculia bacterium]|nr:hypothetical protein [Thermoanaerobaculia bacterium]